MWEVNSSKAIEHERCLYFPSILVKLKVVFTISAVCASNFKTCKCWKRSFWQITNFRSFYWIFPCIYLAHLLISILIFLSQIIYFWHWHLFGHIYKCDKPDSSLNMETRWEHGIKIIQISSKKFFFHFFYFKEHWIQKFCSNVDLRKQDFLSQEKMSHRSPFLTNVNNKDIFNKNLVLWINSKSV